MSFLISCFSRVSRRRAFEVRGKAAASAAVACVCPSNIYICKDDSTSAGECSCFCFLYHNYKATPVRETRSGRRRMEWGAGGRYE